MKVLQVIDKLNAGGAERMVVQLANLLYAHEVSVDVLVFHRGGELEGELDKGIKFRSLNRTHKYNPLTLYRVNRICSAYNIVHTHLRHVHAYISLAKFLFAGRYTVILHDHAAVVNPVPMRLRGIFKPSIYIGVNDELRRWAIEKIGINDKRAFLLENCITGKDYPDHLAKNGRAIIIGNIRKVKNIEFAIAFCWQRGVPLDIYGSILDEGYYKTLLTLAENNDDVRIITGVTDFTGLLPAYTFAIHCSHNETGPLVLLEYLAAGLPFIAFQTGNIAEKIAHRLPQLFLRDFNPATWVHALDTILADKLLPDKMKEVFGEINNPERYFHQCREIYRSIHC